MGTRRRLRHGVGEPAQEYGWKPFGVADYGYDEPLDTVGSWSIWAAVTWGSFDVNPWHAAGILAAAVFYLEQYKARGVRATGASWVHNVQAGYCWYHYFVKKNKGWPVFVGTWMEIAGDGWAVVDEYIVKTGANYGHRVHAEGAFIGFMTALLLDRFRI